MPHSQDPRTPSTSQSDTGSNGARSSTRPTRLMQIVADSHRCEVGLGDFIERCLDSVDLDLDRPMYELDDDAERRLDFCVSSGRYDLAFQIGCGDNPYLTYADEPVLCFVLGLRPDSMSVELCQEDGPPLGREERSLERGWTLLDIGEAFGELASSPRLAVPVRRYLSRWELLRLDAAELESAARELAIAFGSEARLEVTDETRPWRDWFAVVTDDPDWEDVVRRLADLGSPDVDRRTLDALLCVIERSERSLRFALETSLFAIGRRVPGPVDISPSRLEWASRSLRALAAPDERLPGILDARVRTLADHMLRPAAMRRAQQMGDAATILKAPFDERIEALADRFSWTSDELQSLQSALVETETRLDVEAIELFEHCIARYEASMRHILCALQVRRWCEAEGYGTRYEDFDPDTSVLAPPSFAAVFRFVDHFPDIPDTEEAIATLDDWVRQRFVDPRDFENDLFRHIRLIEYTDSNDGETA